MDLILRTKTLSHIERIPSELLAVILTYLPLERRRCALPFLSRHYRQGLPCPYFHMPLLLSDYSRIDDYDYLVEELLRDGSVEIVRYLLQLHPEWISKEACLPLYPRSSALLEVLLQAGADLTAQIDPLYIEEDDEFLAYDGEEGFVYYRNLIHRSRKEHDQSKDYTTVLHLLMLSCSYPTTVTIISYLQQTNNTAILNVEDSERQSALYLLSTNNLSCKLWIDAGALCCYDLHICGPEERIEHRREPHSYAYRIFPSFRIEVNHCFQEEGQYVSKWIGEYIDTAEYDFFAVRGLLLTLIYNISLTYHDTKDYKHFTRSLRISSVSTDDYDGGLSLFRYVILKYYLGLYVTDEETEKQKFRYTFDECIDDPTIPYARVLSTRLPLQVVEYTRALAPGALVQRCILCPSEREPSYRKGIALARDMLLRKKM